MSELGNEATERSPAIAVRLEPGAPGSNGFGLRTAAEHATTRRLGRAVRLTLGYGPGNDQTTAGIALKARIAALEGCLRKRKPRVAREVNALLAGARELLADEGPDTGPADARLERIQAAVAQYRTAQQVYAGYVRKANRVLYVVGVISSATVLVLLPFPLYWAAQQLAGWGSVHSPSREVFAAADLSSMMILFGFAALGSLASVFTRLDRLEVPDVFTWELVFAAGAGRPVVAAVFATIVYAILKGHIISIGGTGGEVGGAIATAAGPYWWCMLVAFLSGYSERFAQDLLGRSPFGGDSVAAASAVLGAVAAAKDDAPRGPHDQHPTPRTPPGSRRPARRAVAQPRTE